MRASIDKAKKDANDDLKRLDAIKQTSTCQTSQAELTEKSIEMHNNLDQPFRVNAWAPQIKDSTIGMSQISPSF